MKKELQELIDEAKQKSKELNIKIRTVGILNIKTGKHLKVDINQNDI